MKALFIVGYWNSGTTLLTDILRKHPTLRLKKARHLPNLEERTLQKIFKKLGTPFFDFGDYSEVRTNGFENYHQPQWNDDQKRRFRKKFDWHFGVPARQRLLLKNPWLFFYNDWINDLFAKDDLKKIVILRNGYSQAVSKDYWLRSQTDPRQHLLARTIFWRKAMERYFQTWFNDPDCLTIRYENLCANPEATIRQVCNFLEIPFDPLADHLPAAFENRMTKWEQLEEPLKEQVIEQVEAIQKKMDTHFPLEINLKFRSDQIWRK